MDRHWQGHKNDKMTKQRRGNNKVSTIQFTNSTQTDQSINNWTSWAWQFVSKRRFLMAKFSVQRTQTSNNLNKLNSFICANLQQRGQQIPLTDNVFPEPVCAMPTRSRPLRANGQPCAWIGVGWVHCCSLITGIMYSAPHQQQLQLISSTVLAHAKRNVAARIVAHHQS